MLLMPKESVLVEAAAALVRANPFGEEHREAMKAFGLFDEPPVWSDPRMQATLRERLGPIVERLRARAGRGGGLGLTEPGGRSSIDGLAVAWAALATPEDSSAYDLGWLGLARPAGSPSLATIRQARARSLASIRRSWPGKRPAARAFRAAIWRAVWLSDAFLEVRAAWPGPVPVLIHGPTGAPRLDVAAQLAEASPAGPDDPQGGRVWRCTLPDRDAPQRIREWQAGLRFVDRLEHASDEVEAALLEQLTEPQEDTRWGFGMATVADDRPLRPELWHRVAGIKLEIPPLPALLGRDGLAAYVGRILASGGIEPSQRQATELATSIELQVGPGYPWPGHLAELTGCVRALLGGANVPRAASRTPSGLPPPLVDGIDDGTVDADTLLSRYCTWVYALTGSYVATAKRLGIDRRTVRRRIDPDLLPIFADRRAD